MLRYLMSGTIPNEAFIKSRIGADAEDMMKRGPSASGSPLTAVSRGVGRRLRRALAQAGGIPRAARYLGKEFRVLICGTLLGKHGVEAIREAVFRTSGECHRWMYDRVSLKRLLERSGFSQIRVCTAFESHIESFASYGLDVVRGQIRKPDSLYMEARK